MSTTMTTVPIEQMGRSDQEIFESATAPEPAPTPAPTAEPTQEAIPEPAQAEPELAPVETPSGRLKDPLTGKFVAKGDKAEPSQDNAPQSAEPEAKAQPDAEPTMPAQVPSWRLAEESQRRRAAEAQTQELTQTVRQMQMQMAQIQQQRQEAPTEPIDPFADPDGYKAQVQAALQKEVQSIRLESNLQIAQFKHGETFDNAYKAFIDNSYAGDEFTYLRVMRSPNPGEAMVQWYREREALSHIGGDPEKWLQSEIDKRMTDPAFQAEVIKRFQASQGNGATPSTQQVQLPPSMSRATAAAPAVGAAPDMSGEGVYARATAKR